MECKKMKMIMQGAEANIYEAELNNEAVIVKERIPKKYRIEAIDNKLRKRRHNKEVKALKKCQKEGIPTPTVKCEDKQKCIIVMEKLPGGTLRDAIISYKEADGCYQNVEALVERVGVYLAIMHQKNIIHGDLTTSNIMVDECDAAVLRTRSSADDTRLWFIDFGLSKTSSSPEDKGVDLYVMERAFYSTHPNSGALFTKLLVAYEKFGENADATAAAADDGGGGEEAADASTNGEKSAKIRKASEATKKVMAKVEEIRMRGRKRVAFG